MTQKCLIITAFIDRETNEVYKLVKPKVKVSGFVSYECRTKVSENCVDIKPLLFEQLMFDKRFDTHKIKLLI